MQKINAFRVGSLTAVLIFHRKKKYDSTAIPRHAKGKIRTLPHIMEVSLENGPIPYSFSNAKGKLLQTSNFGSIYGMCTAPTK